MELILYIIIGLVIGIVLGWLFAKAQCTSRPQAEKDAAQQKYAELEKEFVGFNATATADIRSANQNILEKIQAIEELFIRRIPPHMSIKL